jgi:hypothetical protein
MTRDEKPDHTEDPRGRDVGAGYPEEQPAGANPGKERDGHAGEGAGSDAPDKESRQEGDPQQATGNPGAAG